MLDTSARLLRLLSLLQTPRDWPGSELAERLGVSGRTVRKDIDRLRELGYPVDATRGSTGGYRLAAGTAMPPLLLEVEEAVAVVIALHTAVQGAVPGTEETLLQALAKLKEVLPAPMRRRAGALQAYTVPVPADQAGPTVTAELLSTLAAACRDRERLRFDYRGHDGTESRCEVEPYRAVNWGQRWYLVGWDVDRADWRTFRADRIGHRPPPGPRFEPRAFPHGDVAAYVSRQVAGAAWRYRARVTVHASAEEVTDRINPAVGTVEPVDADTCVLDTGADTVETLGVYLGMLGLDFDVDHPPELVTHLRELSVRYGRAAPTG